MPSKTAIPTNVKIMIVPVFLDLESPPLSSTVTIYSSPTGAISTKSLGISSCGTAVYSDYDSY